MNLISAQLLNKKVMCQLLAQNVHIMLDIHAQIN